MKRLSTTIILSITLIPLLSFLFPNKAVASSHSLTVYPSTLQIEAKPPADAWTPFILSNNSDQPLTLSIGYKAFDPQASQNGTVVFLKDGQQLSGPDQNIFQKIQVVDDSNISHDTIVLGPQQKERFRLRILLPENELAGDYYFSLIFLEKRDKENQNITNNDKEHQKSSSTLKVGIGVNVLLAIGDKEVPRATITAFSTSFFKKSGPALFLLSLHNDGLHFISPHGTILIKIMFGQKVGRVIISKRVLLAGTTRTFAGIDANAFANDSTGEQQELTWPEHFLLGVYSATLSLSLSDKGPTYTRTIHFLAIPLGSIGYALLLIVTIWYLFSRIKKKLLR